MKRTLDDILYPAVLCAAAVLAAAVLVYVRWFSHIPLPTCWIYEELHLYCPGCGCTRAFEALLRGDILRSLRYNAAVCYFAAGVTVYLLTQTVQRLSRGKLRCGLRYRTSTSIWALAFCWATPLCGTFCGTASASRCKKGLLSKESRPFFLLTPPLCKGRRPAGPEGLRLIFSASPRSPLHLQRGWRSGR